MNSKSRKASRESFAGQRARLHFPARPLVAGMGLFAGARRDAPSYSRTRRDIVRDGLIGFIPTGAC